MKLPSSPDYDGDNESSPGVDIPWSRPGERVGKEAVARQSDMISILEHPELPNSQWINDAILETWHEPYSQSPLALERMIHEQARYPPVLTVCIRGTHTITSKKMGFKFKLVKKPRLPRGLFGKRSPRSLIPQDYHMALEEEIIENEEEDFNIKVDMTYLLAQLPSFSVPSNPPFEIPRRLRSELHAVADGVIAMRGGMGVPRIVPDSTSFEPGEGALKFWFRQYVNSTLCRKRFVFSRKVTKFNPDKLKSLLEGLIRSTNYHGCTEIEFVTTKKHLIVTTRRGFVNYLRSHWFMYWFIYEFFGVVFFRALFHVLSNLAPPFSLLLFLVSLLVWILWWPSIYFRFRDYQVIYAEFPFGSSLRKEKNASGARTVNHTGDYVATGERQFYNDWKNAVRRGVRERYRGGEMDTNYLKESNDLVEGFGSSKKGTRFGKGGTRDIKGVDSRPWGMDEDKGTIWPSDMAKIHFGDTSSSGT